MAAKHQTIDINVDSAGNVVRVDRLRFEQVLINLLSNAQRYTPARAATSRSARRSQEAEVIVTVTDSGPGIAPEEQGADLRAILSRRPLRASGSGLAIAKSLVELHNGRIWVESSDGHGSEFCVALPLQPAAGRRALSRRASR